MTNDRWQSTKQLPEPIGRIGVEASAKGVTQILFGGFKVDSAQTPSAAQGHIDRAFAALAAYLESPKKLPAVKFDLEGTDFRQSVWKALQAVPAGKTLSYGELALKAGVNPQAARAVGQAMGANPCPVLIPCHRVLASKQYLGGFSGGLNRKRALLNFEGARFLENPKAAASA